MTDRIAFAGTISAEGRRLKGAVQLAGSRTPRNGEYVQVDPAALVRADASKAFASMEHDDARLLGFVPNGTLSITRTDQGFTWETGDLPNTSYANDALELVRGGYVSGSSFEIDGLRSSFSTDPDGTRVRTYTGIKTLLSVSPVRDPAFPSTAAAFSEEPNVTEPLIPETPVAPPPPAITFAATPSAAKDGKSQLFQRAEAFARDQSLDQLAEQMGNIIGKGAEMSEAEQERYDAFAAVYDERKQADRDSRDRLERIKLADEMRRGVRVKAPETGLFASDDYREAWFGDAGYIRTGDRRALEQFAQSIAGDGSEGGYTVPDGFRNVLITRMKAYGGIASIADSITTSDGQSLRWPTIDDTANSAVIATEGAAAGSGGADAVFAEATLGAYSYDATGAGNLPLLVSKELLQDSAVDIEARLADLLGVRLGRKMAADFGNGTGSSQPKGLFAKSNDVMTATTMYPALVEHTFQVDQAYRDSGNCRFVLGDTILTKIYASLDGNKRPLYTPMNESGGQGRPSGTLLGYPVTLDQSAASLVAFGDIKAGYIIRYVRGVTIDVDPYTAIKSRQIAFHAWARADANVQDANAYSVSSYSGVSADT